MSASQTTGLADKLALAERVLGHEFSDRALLQRALTHPSAAEAGDPTVDNERLEFMGDSLLGFLVAEEAYRRFPTMPEGGLTRVRISLVNGSVLSRVASQLGLADALILGESELRGGKRGLASALENVFEALTAALYLDAGMDAAREWVMRNLGGLMDESLALSQDNPKGMLQEIAQSRGCAPVYRITQQVGPPHDRHFTAVVEIAGEIAGEGTGRSKKDAEALAASAALEHLGK